jgi:hypothetical protein
VITEEQIQVYMETFNVPRNEAIARLQMQLEILGGVYGPGLVYLGEESKPGFKGRGTTGKTQVTPKTKSKQETYNLFWTDENIQNQITSYQTAIGRENLGKPGGYDLWKAIVDQAAEIYNGGAGTKLTPLQILSMSAAASGINTVDTQRQIRKYDADVLKEVAQSIALKKRGAMLTDEELSEAISLADSMIEKGTVTTTKKVRNPKTGKIESVSTTTPGFSQETFDVKLGKKLEEDSPQLVQRRKDIQFMDALSEILAGGQ